MKSKVAVTIDHELIRQVDLLVREARYRNRSQAIEHAVAEQLARFKRLRLIEECAKLDPIEEIALAEEGFDSDVATWPEY
jgi:metal-responsive CopG/Arc/MetJ family transcriptional regulator